MSTLLVLRLIPAILIPQVSFISTGPSMTCNATVNGATLRRSLSPYRFPCPFNGGVAASTVLLRHRWWWRRLKFSKRQSLWNPTNIVLNVIIYYWYGQGRLGSAFVGLEGRVKPNPTSMQFVIKSLFIDICPLIIAHLIFSAFYIITMLLLFGHFLIN